MIFTVRSSQAVLHPLNLGKGFLIDNLSLLSSMTGCRGADGDDDFDGNDGHKHHAHLHKDSCENGGGDVEEDNIDTGQHFHSTSVNSSTFTPDAGSQTLTMIGTGLHGGLPVGFTMIAVGNGGVSPGVFTLILTDGYNVTGILVNGGLLFY
jgi:hypothetical protein